MVGNSDGDEINRDYEERIKLKYDAELQRLKESKDNEVGEDLRFVITRLIECFCIAMFIFGFLWNTTEILKLTTPQFMMLYGGVGAVLTEMIARVLSKKKIKN